MNMKHTFRCGLCAAFLCAALVLGAFPAVGSGESSLLITRTPCPAGCRVLARQGETELCLLGPEEALTDETVRELLSACERGETYTLTDPAFVDAEKTSNRLYGELPSPCGEWLEQDDLWGDNSLCWAASTCNLLVMSGWSRESTEKTDDEDRLFGLFSRSFFNDGGYQKDGIQWFFEGDTDGETYPKETGTPRVPGENARDHTRFVSLNPDSEDQATPEEALELILSLRTGAAVGINVDLDTPLYPLQGDENAEYTAAGLSSKLVDADDVTECLYTYTPEGGIEVLPGDAQGKYVIRGLLHRDEEDGNWYPVEEFMSSYCYMKEIRVDPAMLDLNRPHRMNTVGNGAHALTVNGYIIQNGILTGLFITDSDDDAALWVLTEENEHREARPNRCTLFPAELRTLTDGGDTWCLSGYAGGEALIANITSLAPAPGIR